MSENQDREDVVGKTKELAEAQEVTEAVGEPTVVGEEGAGTIVADTVEVQGGMVQSVEAKTVTVQEGVVLHAQADAVEVHEGLVGAAIAERVQVGQGAVIFTTAQEISGEAQVLIDVKAALIMGAVMGIVSGLVRALVGRKKRS